MKNQSIKKQLREAAVFCQGVVLDVAEQELSTSPRWPALRSRLLKYFSPDRGLIHKIEEIVRDNEVEEILVTTSQSREVLR